MGGLVQVMSTTLVQAPSQNGNTNQKIQLTPWDLQYHLVGVIQKGLLFLNPTDQDKSTQIHHLKHSFSTTLAFFPPLAGRLAITHHEEHSTASSYILCNNAGALFVHAVAETTRVADILQPIYVPPIVRSFFTLNGVQGHQGTSLPLLAVQVTELLDGIFIGCTLNHVAVDGNSFWHFMNSWAEISRGCHKPSKLPSLQRWFPDGIEPPIRFPLTKEDCECPKPQPPPPERFFHFSKEKIALLKAQANAEAGGSRGNISSLQALLTHLWRSVIRCKSFDSQEEVSYFFFVGARPRMVPPLPEGYFGNATMGCRVTMRVGELLEGGVGKGAWEMNKMIGSYSDEKVRHHYECWVKNPTIFKLGDVANCKSLGTSSSPRFDVYGNNFGWGKPVAVRSGSANKSSGKISLFAGAEEGSIDIEVCLPYEILEALGNDHEFVDVVSI